MQHIRTHILRIKTFYDKICIQSNEMKGMKEFIPKKRV